jgi:hypothetical protein
MFYLPSHLNQNLYILVILMFYLPSQLNHNSLSSSLCEKCHFPCNLRFLILCIYKELCFSDLHIFPQKYRISRPIRRTFFPENFDPNLTCVLCAESIISKLINTRTAIIQHLYREVVKFASQSWDLASLLVNGLLSCNKICNNPVFFH